MHSLQIYYTLGEYSTLGPDTYLLLGELWFLINSWAFAQIAQPLPTGYPSVQVTFAPHESACIGMCPTRGMQ